MCMCFMNQDVTLVKSGSSLGFSIIGGTDHSCTPFGSNHSGIFISHVSEHQPSPLLIFISYKLSCIPQTSIKFGFEFMCVP